MHIGVDNEADMEMTIEYCCKVATKSTAGKTVTLSFNSEGMMGIFLENLFDEFESREIPQNTGLHLNIHVLEDEDE